MNNVVRRRSFAKAEITRTHQHALGTLTSLSTVHIENRRKRLEETYAAFAELTIELLQYEKEENYTDPSGDYADYEEKYFEAHALFSQEIKIRSDAQSYPRQQDAVEKLASQHTVFLENLSKSNESNVHLATLKIPTFCGRYEEWPSFKDLFSAAIDSKPGLTDIHKFQYLKSYLDGEALNLVKHMAITNDNYKEAWERLVKRYDRKALIVRSFVKVFMALPRSNTSDVSMLRKIADGADEVLRGMKSLNSNTRDPWLVEILLGKIDDESKREWAAQSDGSDEKTIDDFLNFLSHRCDTLESYQIPSRNARSKTNLVTNVVTVSKSADSCNSAKCTQCKGNHALYKCFQFKKFDITARRNFVKMNNLCFNCLKSGHRSSNCRSTSRCHQCNSNHHTLLHQNPSTYDQITQNDSLVSQMSSATNTDTSNVLCNYSSNQNPSSTTILPTVLGNIKLASGRMLTCRILLDSGSTCNLVTEALVQTLGIPRSNARISVNGISSCNVDVTRGCVRFTLHSLVCNSALDIDAFILPSLSSSVPAHSMDTSSPDWNELLRLPLADPSFAFPGSIDVILGNNQIWDVLTGERKHFGKSLPNALNSIFGWVISGVHTNFEIGDIISANIALVNLDSLIQSFMELEDVQPNNTAMREVDPCESHFVKTHTRDEFGSYIVKYPFKSGSPPITSTLHQSLKRFRQMEYKFRQNSDLKAQYTEFMNEYLSMGHMEEVPIAEENVETNVFYLPHHAVLKPSSTTTKCRVVFDGSCKDTSGYSLNERLHIGAPIQRDLFGVCLRFRQRRFVFSADIEKMFRCIKVHNAHTDIQSIVWRGNETDDIKHYRLLTVTYGLASSPFLAVRVLKQLADDYRQEFPTAAVVVEQDIYVDDVLTGCDTTQDLKQLYSNLVQLLKRGNFHLRKFNSNCSDLLTLIPENCREIGPVELDSSIDASVKILGVFWDPVCDELFIKQKTSPYCSKPTKRYLLSDTAQIYDPLGTISPVVILFKILFQETWLIGLKWDDELPNQLCQRWHRYKEEMSFLSSVKIPRYISSPNSEIELHGFADASSAAIAAVVYSRFEINNCYFTRLIASKTKVKPIKFISIPRMELNAAHLLTKLLTAIKSSLTITISKTTCWTDSEIVLHWLSSPPRRCDTYVCNSTSHILDEFPRENWRHVSSADNSADCASRGMLPSRLITHAIWWSGPQWLAGHEDSWPLHMSKTSSSHADVIGEERKLQVLHIISDDHTLENLINKISSWVRLQRIIARCLRFNRSEITYTSYLSSEELARARDRIIQHVQSCYFSKDITNLKQCKSLCHKSTLIRYTPFLDGRGILRVGGRIKHANINYSTKFPILMPKSSPVSLLIVRYIHESNLHTGVEATFVLVRQQYWILGCSNLVRSVVFKCKRCFMQRRATSAQIMGDLPIPRVTPNRCFLHCGLDYAGPTLIRISKGRNPKLGKAWFAIFICLSTKALHIELVSDLTTDAFLAAFRRFVARRGKPSDMYSDNGTTFHGAKRLIDEFNHKALSEVRMLNVASTLANDGVHWHFIPPSGPHLGGLWESNIKSIKLHLRRVIGQTTFTFEEYSTILTQIEALLNSRPLCAILDTDVDPLTPAHFLIGEPYTAIPEPSLLEIPFNRLKQWQNIQARVQGFWKRWQQEYITSLQRRNKWEQKSPNIPIGAVVVIKEPNLPPAKWVTGRITNTIMGPDGAVRVATVKTAKGEYQRPITKLAILPNY